MGSLREELLEILGPGGLRELSRERGGRRAYVPRQPQDSHWLVRALGREAADRLAWRYGGNRIAIPARADPAALSERIRRLRAQGWSAADIAADAGVSERWVYRVLAR